MRLYWWILRFSYQKQIKIHKVISNYTEKSSKWHSQKLYSIRHFHQFKLNSSQEPQTSKQKIKKIAMKPSLLSHHSPLSSFILIHSHHFGCLLHFRITLQFLNFFKTFVDDEVKELFIFVSWFARRKKSEIEMNENEKFVGMCIKITGIVN